jgi:DNA-binding transcriptional ArsR family regulator
MSAVPHAGDAAQHRLGQSRDLAGMNFMYRDIESLLSSPQDDQYAQIFEALSEPIRMQIVRQIASADELACTTLDETLPISKSTISYHIKILSHAQLISVRKDGRYYHYRLRREVFEQFLPTFLDRVARSSKRARSSRLKRQLATA